MDCCSGWKGTSASDGVGGRCKEDMASHLLQLMTFSGDIMGLVESKALSNTIETYFQRFSTKYDKFQPNIQIFDYSISCLVSHINH